MIDIIVSVLLVLGLVFFTGTIIGLLRFPDFYTRMHAAGKADTLSSLLILSGLALFNLHHLGVAEFLVSIKILLIIAFIFISSPTATHILMDSGYEAKVPHWRKGDEDVE